MKYIDENTGKIMKFGNTYVLDFCHIYFKIFLLVQLWLVLSSLAKNAI